MTDLEIIKTEAFANKLYESHKTVGVNLSKISHQRKRLVWDRLRFISKENLYREFVLVIHKASKLSSIERKYILSLGVETLEALKKEDSDKVESSDTL